MATLLSHHGAAQRVHPSAFVADGAWLIGEVEIGQDASIWFNAVLRGDINRIVVGDRSNVQDGVVMHVTRLLATVVGKDVTVGHKAMLHGCEVGDTCLIGMNAVVLDGARVGPEAVVAAGAVVREGFQVPGGTLVAGVPAKVIRDLTPQERGLLLESAQNYIEYARTYFRHKG